MTTRRVLAAMALLGTINLVLLGKVLVNQSSQGYAARSTQCRTFPVSIKLYRAAERYRLITPADLRTYLAARPSGCPPSSDLK